MDGNATGKPRSAASAVMRQRSSRLAATPPLTRTARAPKCSAAAKTVRLASPITTITDPRCKILYIEDKIPNVELMRAIIEDLSNTRFVDAQTVEEGLKIARSLRPDLVITDIHLPDGKGFDVLQGLRADGRTAQIPVIALTADAMPSNMHNMGLAGFDHILTKPLKIPDLMKILRATLRAA